MAYLDFATHDLTGFAHPAIAPAAPTAGLSDLERKAVMLAAIDPISSIPDPGFRRRIRDLLLGAERINPLADPRLESLRRFAVALVHRRDDLAAREEGQLTALGFAPARIGEARALARELALSVLNPWHHKAMA
jgi:hypothetical protein